MGKRKTGEFIAVDASGNRYTIIKYTDVETSRTFGASEAVTGLDEYRLATGEPVNRISDGEFFAVISEITLRPICSCFCRAENGSSDQPSPRQSLSRDRVSSNSMTRIYRRREFGPPAAGPTSHPST